VDTLLLTLPAVAGAIADAVLRPERMAAVMDAQLLATDLADYLVRRGVPFRQSHEVIGRLVRRAEREGVGLDALDPAAFREEHPLFDDDVRERPYASHEGAELPEVEGLLPVRGGALRIRVHLDQEPVRSRRHGGEGERLHQAAHPSGVGGVRDHR
jgi:hypothetical protein